MDKNRFFTELEGGRNTPVDYSELNKKLSETGKSSAVVTATRLEQPSALQCNSIIIIIILSCSSLASTNESYKDDFDSLSTQDHASSSGDSSNTVTHMELEAEGSALKEDATVMKETNNMQHGFTLSPIHTSSLQTTSLHDSGSNLESSLFADVRVPKEISKTEMESPSKPKLMITGLGDRHEKKLLIGRSSKSNAEERTPVTVPTSSVLPQELSSSTESSRSVISHSTSLNDGGQKKFTPLAPIPSESMAASGVIPKVDSITEEDKNVPILKPLGTGKILSKQFVVSDDSRPSELNVKAEPVLSSVRSDTPGMVHGESNSDLWRSAKLTTVPSSSSFHVNPNVGNSEAAIDSLTAVTDVPNSSVGGVDSELAELQSALARAGLPQIASTQQITRNEMSHGSTPSHKNTTTEKSDHPVEDLLYDDFNIQEIIRAITGEELASAGKEILEGRDLPTASQGTRSMKNDSPRDLKCDTKPKAVRSRTNKQKARLSSSRESLTSQTSKSNLSFRKQTASSAVHSRTNTNSNEKENSSQAVKKSKLPQRSGKPGSKKSTGRALKQTQPAPSLSPRPISSPMQHIESSPLSDLEVRSNTDLPGNQQRTRDSVKMVVMEEPVIKEVNISLIPLDIVTI